MTKHKLLGDRLQYSHRPKLTSTLTSDLTGDILVKLLTETRDTLALQITSDIDDRMKEQSL